MCRQLSHNERTLIKAKEVLKTEEGFLGGYLIKLHQLKIQKQELSYTIDNWIFWGLQLTQEPVRSALEVARKVSDRIRHTNHKIKKSKRIIRRIKFIIIKLNERIAFEN